MTNLKKMRRARGLTQEQLADRAGLNVRTLQGYEQGRLDLAKATLGTVVLIAAALDCAPADILPDGDEADWLNMNGV